MKKFIFCISLALTGLMTACVDKNQVVDEESKPNWLGESIYQELKNPTQLTGTFATYLRLIDDLGYSETLNRTGSMTIFPANDEAFQRFFASNSWGVSSYEDLTQAQKKLLLYNSMLKNAMLVGMLSNVYDSSTEGMEAGVAMKHETNVNVVDTIQHLIDGSQMPQGNIYWDNYRSTGIHLVSDATVPMMLHFTREHMLNNSIKVTGDKDQDNDFAILTGSEYEDGMAYVYGDQIIKSDVTCQNGYIHQMKDVIVPPGNMAQVLRSDNETSYFSRILDYYSAPYESPRVTEQYNAVALETGQQPIDMIYEMRYFTDDSNHPQGTYPDGNIINGTSKLKFDPGWNQYSPNSGSRSIGDVGAMFIPTDEAVETFFLEGGDGAYLIDLYGKHNAAGVVENTKANLKENIDSLFAQRPDILAKFLNNLMRPSFTATVPSKFTTIFSDANEYMGITTNTLQKTTDGKYDIKFANNGVIYKMNELIAPDEFRSVKAPASVYKDMHVMNWAVDDKTYLKVYFYFYLMAMKSTFAFFIPDDAAFKQYYVDPVSLKRSQPRALKFSYEADTTMVNGRQYVSGASVRVREYAYNPTTNTVGAALNNGRVINLAESNNANATAIYPLLIDILNYHTVVLEDIPLGVNKYYKTKHGGEIYLPNKSYQVNDVVMSGQQIDNGVDASRITAVYPEKNGTAFRINHVIQAPRNSVYKTLQDHPDRFSEFLDFCDKFSNSAWLRWAGISNTPNAFGTSEQDAYIIFTANRGTTAEGRNSCMDYNVKMFNTYNYTLYAPNNEAMKAAYANGLPTWDEIERMYNEYADETGAEAEKAQKKAKLMIDQMSDFARYHFQSVSIYADQQVEGGRFNSMSTNSMGLAIEMDVTGGSDKLYVSDGLKDAQGNHTHTVTVDNSNGKLTNLMCRDYWFDNDRTRATSIYTSSFCVVHEIDEALNSGQKFDYSALQIKKK